MSYLDISAKHIKGFEDQIAYMYRDSSRAGNCTCGSGFLISSALAAAAFPFKTPSGVAATPLQIRQEYDRVMAMPAGLLATHYYVPAALTLTPAFMDAWLAKLLANCEAQLRTILPTYDAQPESVKVAEIDMIFNLGKGGVKPPRGFLAYRDFIAAVGRGDYLAAAPQSHRDGISDARNVWTFEMVKSGWAAPTAAAL